MRPNSELKIHFVNVNHGDATIIEFPDYTIPPRARFGVVDFGAKQKEDRSLTTDYMKALVEVRKGNDQELKYVIEFACCSHPHDDHYGGLSRFMDAFTDPHDEENNKVQAFWDCGFRTNAVNYNRMLRDILDNKNIRFHRLGAGSEYEYGPVRITVLAPSVDLRNRFDTYGIGKNDSSIVLKIKYRDSYVILAGDAEFASWGKSTEEFPRRERINFYEDALGLSEREETSDQLKCDLLKLSHHGSMHGTSLEYLERIQPNRVVIPAGSDAWYQVKKSDWLGDFPHPLTTKTLEVLEKSLGSTIGRHITGEEGNLIFKYNGGWTPRQVVGFLERPDAPGFQAALDNNWA